MSEDNNSISRLRIRRRAKIENERQRQFSDHGSEEQSHAENHIELDDQRTEVRAIEHKPAVSDSQQTETESQRQASSPSLLEVARKHIQPLVEKKLLPEEIQKSSRGVLARRIAVILNEWLAATGQEMNLVDQRNVITYLINAVSYKDKPLPAVVDKTASRPQVSQQHNPEKKSSEQQSYNTKSSMKSSTSAPVNAAKEKVQEILMNRIDTVAAATLPREELSAQLNEIVGDILTEQRMQLNRREKEELVELLLNDMLGLGPLEKLLCDPSITDILVNGPKQVYVERKGLLELTDITFRDNTHLMNISTRIVSQVGRRIDESSPMVDARLTDGSRVNIIAPPLALDGPSLSIRRFSDKGITLDTMIGQGNLSEAMGKMLGIASKCRLNIIVSGGTGSGKTTLLNALSRNIDMGERVVTCEDSAELRLQQPHVVRLETRPPNLEGEGEITIRDLVKNSLRMRPDRIIIGECRGGEIIDMLQAMNTGHDGSMSTIHANTPRTCLTRMENMLNMAGFNMPQSVIRNMLSSAVNLIVQIARMRDGMRRITHITEIVGLDENTVLTQDLFWFKYREQDSKGAIKGDFISADIRPKFMERAEYFGCADELLEVMRGH